MLTFKDEAALTTAVLERRHDSEDERKQLSMRTARGQLMYLGHQWVQRNYSTIDKMTIHGSSYDPRRGPIKATLNRITKNTIRSTSQTSPIDLFVDAVQPETGGSVLDAETADLVERTSNPAIKGARSLSPAKRANSMRGISGSWGLGHMIENGMVRSFDFDPVELSLDPTNQDEDLSSQEMVVHSVVWTLDKIRRVWGEDFISKEEEEKLGTIGQLKQWYVAANRLSGGELYTEYTKRSKQKGAVVHMVYVKGEAERFDRMYVGVQHDRTEIRWTNFKEPDNPFGGNGMPLSLLVGFRRPGSRHGISDVHMQVDDQNLVNFLGSMMLQQQYDAMSRSALVADSRAFSRGITRQNIQDQATSRLIHMDGSDPNAEKPYYLTAPGADPGLVQMLLMFEQRQKQQAMRTDAHDGSLKSHVPDNSFQTAIELSDQPLDDRVRDDVRTLERWLDVLVGTTVRLLKQRQRPVIDMLLTAGLDEMDIGRLVNSVDPHRLPAELKMRHQSLRPQPRSVRQSNLQRAMDAGAVTGAQARAAMARDLDLALSGYDAAIAREARAMVADLLRGVPFEPIPLQVEAHVAVLEALEMARMSREVRSNPELAQAVTEAIMLQRQLNEAPPEGAGGEAAPAAPGPLDELNLQELVDSGGISIPGAA